MRFAHRRRGRAANLAVALWLLCSLAFDAAPPAARGAPSRAAGPLVVSWLVVDTARPQRAYVGGYTALASDPEYKGAAACGPRAPRTTDGGATWQLLPGGRGFINLNEPIVRASHNGCVPPDRLILSPDGTDSFALGYNPYCASSYGCGPNLAHSADGGMHWVDVLDASGEGGGYPSVSSFSISRADPRRVYLTFFDYPSGEFVARSDDGGAHVRVTIDSDKYLLPDGSHLISHGLFGQVLADPTARDTVYLGLGLPITPRAVNLARSDDGGASWRLLRLPLRVDGVVRNNDLKASQGFELATDPRLPGAVVLHPWNVPGVPGDRRWASLDHGATWKQIACPGALRGTCPTYSLDNVFGAGRAYGIYADGVHAFAGAGPAGPRLALSDRLPCHGADLLDAGGGAHAGDPVYLLCQAPLVQRTILSATLPYNSDTSRVGTLYRSTDAGASWRKLDPTAGW